MAEAVRSHPELEGAQQAVVVRVLNNNCLMAQVGGQRRILLGRGIGFGKHLGDIIAVSDAEEIFEPSTSVELRDLSDLVAELPLEVFAVARKVADYAQETCGIAPSQSLLLSLADHLRFAVERGKTGQRIGFPLKWEIEQLYPAESALGRKFVQVAEAELGTRIDPSESTAFAIHFVNAQFARSDISEMVSMTESLDRVVSMVRQELGLTEDDGVSVARFVTHLRFLYSRLSSGTTFQDDNLVVSRFELPAPVEDLAVRVSQEVDRWGAGFSNAEMTYLRLHIGRLASIAGNKKDR